MNLMEAVKSGKPFRLPGGEYYGWIVVKGEKFVRQDDPMVSVLFGPADFRDDAWEIQETTVTITRSQFWEAFEAATKECPVSRHRIAQGSWWPDADEVASIMAKKLGLEE